MGRPLPPFTFLTLLVVFFFFFLPSGLVLAGEQPDLTAAEITDDKSDGFAPGFGVSALEAAGEGLHQADRDVGYLGEGEIFCAPEVCQTKSTAEKGLWGTRSGLEGNRDRDREAIMRVSGARKGEKELTTRTHSRPATEG